MNDELYHYGVPGMKWGVRRAQKQLSRLTGRDRSKISAEEAERFRKDVKSASKMKDQNVREQWVKSVSGKGSSGKKYADAVLTQVKHDKISKAVKGPAIVAGTIAAAPFLALGVVGLQEGLAPITRPIGAAVGKAGRAVGKGVEKTLLWWK